MLFSFKLGESHFAVKKEIILPILFLGFGAVYYHQTLGLSDNALAFPRFLLVVMVICGIGVLASCVTKVSPEEAAAQQEKILPKIVILFTLLLIAFVCLFDFLGVYISLFLFCMVGMFLAGRRNFIKMAVVAIGVDLFIWAVFAAWLQVRMPMGILGAIF